MEPTWIAEEQVIWLYTDGSRVPGRIAVGLPMQITDDEAHCMVALDGLDHLSFPMLGSSPLQVLLLAVRHLGMRIQDFMSKGGRVLDPVDDANFGIEHLFGPLLRHPPDEPPPIDNDVNNKGGR
jgi:hypothetical protein